MCLPIQTVWGLVVRNSSSVTVCDAKAQCVMFPISFIRDIGWNAALNSTNSILMWVLLPSTCAKTELKSVKMASPVDLLVLNANW